MRSDCRPGCGACCIAPSINTAYLGHPQGKPAGTACAHLADNFRCRLWGRPERPSFCAGLQPGVDMCGSDRQQALRWLTALEQATQCR